MHEPTSDAVILAQSKRIAALEAEVDQLRETVKTGKHNRRLHYCAVEWANARRNKEDRLKKYREFRVATLSDPNTFDDHNLAHRIIHESDEYREMLSASRYVVIAEGKLIKAIEGHTASLEVALPPS